MANTARAITTETTRWRGRLAAGWRFTRHLAEMVVAMLLGMAVMGLAFEVLGQPPGHDGMLGMYAYMAVAMSAPMVAWMRYRGHPWSDCWEMTAAMVVPMYALVLPVAAGLVEMSHGAVMAYSHLAMIVGMLLLMLYRWDTYAHGAHCHRPGEPGADGAERVVDPVCGMAVDPRAAAGSAEHRGRTYHFCSSACRAAFAEQPTAFPRRDTPRRRDRASGPGPADGAGRRPRGR